MTGRLHPLSWAAWLAAVCVALSATRNPLHLGLALLCVGLTAAARGPAPGAAQGRPLRLAAGVVAAAALFNLLVARAGATAILRLPDGWPVIGGPLTLESLAFGALSGLALAGVLVAFSTAQGAVPTRALLDMLPAAFAPLAVTLTVAVAFIPATLRQLRAVREAQAIRGHRLRGLRDWVSLVIPLLIGGLDRALALAEALAARGFPPPPPRRAAAWLVAAGLGALAGGLVAQAWGGPAGPWLVGAGLALTGLALALAGRDAPRVRYRRYGWLRRDSLVAGGALAAALAFALPPPAAWQAALAYSPYPLLAAPHFSPLLGLATLGLAGPGAAMLLAPGGDR